MTEEVRAFTTEEVRAIERFMSALPSGDKMLFGDDGGFAGTFVIEGYEIPPHRIYYDYEFDSWVLALTGKAADAVVTVEMIAGVVKAHQLGENWGDDGVGYVGCGDCGEWFGKALEGGWDRAFMHTAEAVHRLYRGEAGAMSVCDCPVTALTIVDGCEHDQMRRSREEPAPHKDGERR